MSEKKNRYLAERSLATAEEDLDAATVMTGAGKYAQACFHAQHSGEKAVKALWFLIDADPWGHSVQRLVTDFPQASTLPDLDTLIDYAAMLDKLYIPTWYPNGLPDLTPGQVFRSKDAQLAPATAAAMVAACRQWMEAQSG